MNLANKIHTNLRKALLPIALAMSMPFSSCQTYTAKQEYTQKTDNTSYQKETEKKQSLEKLLEEGTKYMQSNEYDKATASYQKVLELDQYNINALNNIGHALVSKESYEEALKYFDKALSIEPNISSILNNKAQALYKLGKIEEAKTLFDQAIENATDYVLKAEILRNRNRLLGKAKEKTNKEVLITKGVEIIEGGKLNPFVLEHLLKTDSALTDEEKSYFPLALGNSWIYKKTKNTSSIVYKLETITCKGVDGKTRKADVIGESFFNQNVTDETYSITDTYSIPEKEKNKFFKVKVEGDNPRDGRYTSGYVKDIKDIYWVYNGTGLLEIRSSDNCLTETWISNLSPSLLDLSVPQIFMQLRTEKLPEDIKDITVLNKIYSDVLKTTLKVRHRSNFSIESYFAKGVGLVKEVQYNDKGEETYSLELKSYNVK